MHGLVVIEGMTLSGHPWIINEIQDCQSYDLQNIGLKIHNFSLELKQYKTPTSASCWIISTLMRRYVFFNPRFCKSWDCPNPRLLRSWDYLIGRP